MDAAASQNTDSPEHPRALLRSLVFGNLATCLALAFAAAQSFLALWFLSVWTDRNALGTTGWAVVTAALAALHYLALGHGRNARVLTHCFTPVPQVYVIAAFSSVIVAAFVIFSLVAGAAIASIVGWAGPAHGLAFSLLRAVTTAAAAFGLGAVAIGVSSARRPPICRRVRIEVAELPTPLHGIRIAHVSDIHVGNGFDVERLRALVARINALGADIIAITGDVFDRDPSVVAAGARELAALSARCGVFMVLGNHDGYTGNKLVVTSMSKHAPHVRILRGEVVRIDCPAPFHVAGIDDPGEDWRLTAAGVSAVDALAQRLPCTSPRLLLVHRPDVFAYAARAGFDVVLAGHYHGGQIALPGSGGRLNPARLLSDWFAGTHRIGKCTLHVSRGVGCTGPRLRVACAPEFSLIELAPAGGKDVAPIQASPDRTINHE